MRGFGLFGALLVVVLAIVAGAIGYQMGVGANVAATITTTTGAVVAYPVHAWGFGFPFFGLFFGLLILFLIFGLIRRAVWGGHHGYGPRGYGMGGYDRRGWGDKSVPPMADEMLSRWHREAHGEPGSSAAPGPQESDKPAG